MNIFDTEKLFSSVNAFDVAIYIGMDVITKGNRHYILCPGHLDRLGRYDNNFGSAVLSDNGYYCFACGQSVNIIDMVAEYYKNYLNINLTYPQILEILAEASGGKELYLIKKNKNKKQFIPKEDEGFPLTKEEISLLNLTTNSNNKCYLSNNPNFDKKNEEIGLHSNKYYFYNKKEKDFNSENIFFKNNPYSLFTFYNEDKECCLEMLLNKAKEALKFHQNQIKLIKDINLSLITDYDITTLENSMKEISLKKIVKIKGIIEKLNDLLGNNTSHYTTPDTTVYKEVYQVASTTEGPF